MTASTETPAASGGLLRSATYVTVLLSLVNVFNYMDRMILAVLVEPIKKELVLSDSQIGLLTGFAFVAVYAAVGLPMARLADRFGRRWVLAGSLAVWSLMTVACGFVRSFGQLAFVRAGVGVGEAGGMPASHALLADIYPPHRRALPIAIMTSGASLGITAGLTAGGLIAASYGWRTAFILVGLPGLILAAIVALTLPEPARDRAKRVEPPPLMPTIKKLARIRTYRWLVCAHPFYSFVTAGLVAWLPPFFMRTHGMQVGEVGTFFGISYGIGIVAGGVLAAYVLQRICPTPRRGLLLGGWLMLLSFPMFASAMLVDSKWLALTLMMLFGALAGGAGGPFIAGQQGVVGTEIRATASAVSVFFAAYVGSGVGPLLVGMGSDALTPAYGAGALRIVLLVASLTAILPGIFMIRASKTFDADAVI